MSAAEGTRRPAPKKNAKAKKQDSDTGDFLNVAEAQAYFRNLVSLKDVTFPERFKRFHKRVGLGKEPSTAAALNFLDLLEVPRANVHQNVLDNLKKKIFEMIDSGKLDQHQLQQLLESSFSYIKIKELQAIPVKVIHSISVVSGPHLQSLIDIQKKEPEIFESLGLQQRIKWLAWETSTEVFESVISPKLMAYMSHKGSASLESAANTIHTRKPFPTDVRRKNTKESMDYLASCVGSSAILVGYIGDYIGTMYAAEKDDSRSNLWCTLLTDVLFTVRQNGGVNVVNEGVCGLARFLDTCVKNCDFDDGKLKKLQELLSKLPQVDLTLIADTTGGAGKPSWRKLMEVLNNAWNDLTKMDSKDVFAAPVSDTQAPDYSKIIKNPMDLKTMKKKIDEGEYKSLQDMDRDVKLMFNNCQQYNAPGSPYFKLAGKFSAAWKDTIMVKCNMQLSNTSSEPGTPRSHKRRHHEIEMEPSSSTNADKSTIVLSVLSSTSGGTKNLGVAAMLLADPFFTKLLYFHLIDAVVHCYDQKLLPKDHPSMPALIQLMELGASARGEMKRTKTVSIPGSNTRLIRIHMPKVVMLYAEMMSPDTAPQKVSKNFLKDRWEMAFKDCPVVLPRLLFTMALTKLAEGEGQVLKIILPVLKIAVTAEIPVKVADMRYIWTTLALLLRAPKTGKRRIDEASWTQAISFFKYAMTRSHCSCAVHDQLLEMIAYNKALEKESSSKSDADQSKVPTGSGSSTAAVSKSGGETPVSKTMSETLDALFDTSVKRLLSDSDVAKSFEALWEDPSFHRSREAYEKVFKVCPDWRSKLPFKKVDAMVID